MTGPPSWVYYGERLWNRGEVSERCCDSYVAQEISVALGPGSVFGYPALRLIQGGSALPRTHLAIALSTHTGSSGGEDV